jgi:site-specific DNA-methyltransferase (adenine-specific)
MAYCFGEPIPSALGRRLIPGLGPKAQPNSRLPGGHPCTRTLNHFQWLVYWHSTPNEVIVDPFMGSATTGAACIELGRRFIGVEIDERYFGLACLRIEEASRQSRLFPEIAPAQSQQGLFA